MRESIKRVLSSLVLFLPLLMPLGSFATKNGVYFNNLKDNQEVTSPLIVEMGITGMSVGPAGQLVEGVGHHHLIINGEFVKEGQPVPADQRHIHFGGGQTQTELNLTPGKYTLTLQFADGLHRSYGKDWSSTIQIVVR